MGLQLTSLMYGGIFLKENPPSSVVKKFMQQFFESTIGNMKLNSFLNQDVIKSQIDHADYLTKYTAINPIIYFSFRIRNITKMENALNKLDTIHQAVKSNQTVPFEDTISLKDFAIISDLAKTFPTLELLDKSGFIDGNAKLETLFKNATKAKDIISNLEKDNIEDLQKAGLGVLILDNTYKKSNVTGMTRKFIDKVSNLFSQHGHASMLHFNKDQKAQRVHINPGLSKDAFDINKQLYSNMYQIDSTALIPKETHQLMQQVYGPDWKAEITNKFKIIENEQYTNVRANFGNIEASSIKEQYKAGPANIIPLGHKQISSNNFQELHDKIMSGEYAKQKSLKFMF